MASLIDTTSIAVWAEGNIGPQAALRQRVILPGGLYPVLFGSGATVQFVMRLVSGADITAGAPKVAYSVGVMYDPTSINPDTGFAYNANPADATDLGQGWIGYEPIAADVDTPGTYVYRWRILFADTSLVSFPNKDWKRIDVVAELDDPAPFPV
jgi:hypothetical protein